MFRREQKASGLSLAGRSRRRGKMSAGVYIVRHDEQSFNTLYIKADWRFADTIA